VRVATTFDRSGFGRWINSPSGRVFRVAAGGAFLLVGLRSRRTVAGRASIAWSALPLSAGALDVCYISLALGGPFRGSACRSA
jgi:hypothetical protein